MIIYTRHVTTGAACVKLTSLEDAFMTQRRLDSSARGFMVQIFDSRHLTFNRGGGRSSDGRHI